MKKPKQLLTNKKGISSLFIGIYVTLLLLVLISTLFVGLSVSNSSVTNYLKVEQDRMQEKILIAGPNALIIDANGSIRALLVNNTGALTARIRALYIAGKFVCDPSTLPGDSYIAPQGSMWMNLSSVNPPIVLNSKTLNGLWTVTTERGIKSFDTGENLWLGPPGYSSDPNRMYFGPLLLFYNWFHWSNDGGTTWNNGWSIPSAAKNVIWRILIANIDDRQIFLDTESSFALVYNSKQSGKTAIWKIDPYVNPQSLNPLNLGLEAGHYYFLHFSVPSGNVALSSMGSPYNINLNFLTFMGKFVEPNGSLTPFGQTIPFEAVLVTD